MLRSVWVRTQSWWHGGKRWNRLRVLWLAVAIAAISVGCSAGRGSDARDERDPLFRRAVARKNAGDVDGAIEAFNRALEKHAGLARAHFELGVLYDLKKQDYVRAIYHYQRYLELRPQAEKRELVEGLIRQAHISFAATLPTVPDGAIQEIAMLKKEVALLRSQLDARGAAASPAAAAKPSAPIAAPPPAAAAPPPPKPAPALPPMQEYMVQKGDTLSSIAGKIYGDPNKWRVIYDANRNTLPKPESIRAGQTLLIPRSVPQER